MAESGNDGSAGLCVDDAWHMDMFPTVWVAAATDARGR